MATKTISIDIEAYERLRQARILPTESFSEVIHRAIWPQSTKTCGALLAFLSDKPTYLGEEEIRHLEQAQLNDPHPQNPWQ
ncbi:MAG TPA: antitoxin VapB family protein [Candidatus Paceibacterota bacterium]|nr:antitoxin VapB family protein [Verrucomicrobiota bacterium]HRY50892.1 antitoxin VapB family protein [Candidatus Paceibacterota bacterium]HSA01702.1 antitoxin VapB family protein [Candidatus Paceibacterota bacterium]